LNQKGGTEGHESKEDIVHKKHRGKVTTVFKTAITAKIFKLIS